MGRGTYLFTGLEPGEWQVNGVTTPGGYTRWATKDIPANNRVAVENRRTSRALMVFRVDRPGRVTVEAERTVSQYHWSYRTLKERGPWEDKNEANAWMECIAWSELVVPEGHECIRNRYMYELRWFDIPWWKFVGQASSQTRVLRGAGRSGRVLSRPEPLGRFMTGTGAAMQSPSFGTENFTPKTPPAFPNFYDRQDRLEMTGIANGLNTFPVWSGAGANLVEVRPPGAPRDYLWVYPNGQTSVNYLRYRTAGECYTRLTGVPGGPNYDWRVHRCGGTDVYWGGLDFTGVGVLLMAKGWCRNHELDQYYEVEIRDENGLVYTREANADDSWIRMGWWTSPSGFGGLGWTDCDMTDPEAVYNPPLNCGAGFAGCGPAQVFVPAIHPRLGGGTVTERAANYLPGA